MLRAPIEKGSLEPLRNNASGVFDRRRFIESIGQLGHARAIGRGTTAAGALDLRCGGGGALGIGTGDGGLSFRRLHCRQSELDGAMIDALDYLLISKAEASEELA